VNRQAISNIEMGIADPTTETVHRLARALGVDGAWLAALDDKEEARPE
jgi:transcriptional regulator with XRE-family HTH domain